MGRGEPPQGEALKEVRVCRHKGLLISEPAEVRTRGHDMHVEERSGT